MVMVCFWSLLLLCVFICVTNGIAVYKKVNQTVGDATINHIGVNVAQDKMLNTTAHASYNTSNEKECIIKCLFQTNGCSSLNYFKEKVRIKENCFLLKDNWFEKKESLQTANNVLHIYVKNTGCDRQLCLNGGTCIPNYQRDTFQCTCASSYHGTFCETNIEIPAPAYEYSFDNNFENSGYRPTGMVILKNEGRLIYVPERPGKVLSCGTQNCVTNIHTEGQWLEPDFNTKLTISVWVKLRYHEISEVQDESWYACVVNRWHRGFAICYVHERKGWYFTAYGSSNQYELYNGLSYDRAQRWQHLALVWNKPVLKGFMNGEKGTEYEKEHIEISDSQVELTPGWRIFTTDGAGNKNNPMYIDDLSVWYSALSDDKIKQIYEDSRYT